MDINNPLVQRAEARKYTADVFSVLPLGDGLFAIYGPRRQLHAIGTWDELPAALATIPKSTHTIRPIETFDLEINL